MRKVGRRSLMVVTRNVTLTRQMQESEPELSEALTARFLALKQGDRYGRHVLLTPRGAETVRRREDWLTNATLIRKRQTWEVAYIGRHHHEVRGVQGSDKPNRGSRHQRLRWLPRLRPVRPRGGL